MKITKDVINKWLKDNRYPRDYLASKCGVSTGAVSNWLRDKNPRPIPSKVVLIIESLMEVDKEKAAAASITPQNLVLTFDEETFENICRAGMLNNETPKEWASRTLNEVSLDDLDQMMSEPKANGKTA